MQPPNGVPPPFENYRFQMGITVMGFAEHFELSLVGQNVLKILPVQSYFSSSVQWRHLTHYDPIFLCLILDIFELADYRQTEIIMVSHETQTFIGLELETVSLAKFNLMNFPIHLILTPLEYV